MALVVVAAIGLAVSGCEDVGKVRVIGDVLSPTTAVPPTSAPTTTVVDTVTTATATTVARPEGLAVDGNRLIGPDGAPLRLIGVNRSGAEYSCVQNQGIWDGAADAAFVETMASWGINSVRVPLNEHCWLAVNEAPPEFSGQIYRDAIVEFVRLLNDRGLVAILDLHWSAPGNALAERNMPMPNADYGAEFWRSVATVFRDEEFVLFDVFNEPHDIDWECWRDGCTMPEKYGAYQAIGMQALVDVIRSTGARQPIVLSGLRYANDLTQWLEFAPIDPEGALIAGFHLYNFNQCITPKCWEDTVEPVAAEVPVITAELGENTCSGDFVVEFMNWADERGISYLGWTFNAWDCRQGPALIIDETGAPTPYGQRYRDHVLGLPMPPVTVSGS